MTSNSERLDDVRTVLVPDLDGELLVPLRALEEVLLSLSMWEDDDVEDPPEDREPLTLPEPLANGAALAAVQRLSEALRPTQSLGPERGRLLAPDGSYEHAPLSVLELSAADVATLSAAAAALGHPGLDPDVADVVTTHAHTLGGTYRVPGADRTELVSLIARLAGLLDLEATDDSRLLVERLRVNPPERDLALTDAEERAYARTADRLNHMWAHGSGVDRFLY
jgi:hypothetical protein